MTFLTNSRHPGRPARAGFTLVELLVVTLVVAILATIVFSVWSGALEMGKEARTRAQIAQINELLTPIWESYRTRRVAIPPELLENVDRRDRKALARIRLHLLRRLMRLELPDRITDVVPDKTANGGGEEERPPRAELYWQEVQSQVRAQEQRYQSMPREERGSMPRGWNRTYQGAECLYLILSSIRDGETDGLRFFRESEIGDVDQDGMKEILDGWGNPISFVRWPAGFESDKQRPSDAQWRKVNPDPFDPLRVYSDSYFIYPLVFSAGPDGQSRIWTGKNRPAPGPEPDTYRTPEITEQDIQAIDSEDRQELDNYLDTYFVCYKQAHNPYLPFPLDKDAPDTPLQVGQQMVRVVDQGFLDNIHNHIMRPRIR